VLFYALSGSLVWLRFGALWIFVGGAAAVSGFILGVIYAYQAARATVDTAPSRRRAAVCIAVSLLNVPVAFGCVLTIVNLNERPPSVRITLKNVGERFISDCYIVHNGKSIECGPIAPHRTVSGIGAESGDSFAIEIRRGSERTFRRIGSFLIPKGLSLSLPGVVEIADNDEARFTLDK
jgi:hypothetical protein